MTEAEGSLAATTPPSEPAIAPEPAQAPVGDGGRRPSGRRWLIIGGIALVFLFLVGAEHGSERHRPLHEGVRLLRSLRGCNGRIRGDWEGGDRERPRRGEGAA